MYAQPACCRRTISASAMAPETKPWMIAVPHDHRVDEQYCAAGDETHCRSGIHSQVIYHFLFLAFGFARGKAAEPVWMPTFAKLSIDDASKVNIAAMHPDFC